MVDANMEQNILKLIFDFTKNIIDTNRNHISFNIKTAGGISFNFNSGPRNYQDQVIKRRKSPSQQARDKKRREEYLQRKRDQGRTLAENPANPINALNPGGAAEAAAVSGVEVAENHCEVPDRDKHIISPNTANIIRFTPNLTRATVPSKSSTPFFTPPSHIGTTPSPHIWSHCPHREQFVFPSPRSRECEMSLRPSWAQ